MLLRPAAALALILASTSLSSCVTPATTPDMASVAPLAVAPPGEPVVVASRADDFRLVDQNSRAHLLSYYKHVPAIVLIAHRANDAAMRAEIPAIDQLASEFATSGVELFLINSTLGLTRETIAADLAATGLDARVLMDDAQLVGESLGISQVAQTLVISPSTRKIVYSGPVSGAQAAISALVKGEAVAPQTVGLTTPTLSFPLRERKAEFERISYTSEVAPILAKNCVACHSQGGIGPFAMDSYEAVRQWSGMIREAVRTDRMPPFHADPHIGAFADDGNLSTVDMQTLIHWIEAGAPRGEGGDPLKTNAKPAPEWELGEPDLIIELPAYTVPASGVVDYQNPIVTNPLLQGRWLRAATVKPSDRQAVHHLLSNGAGSYAVGAETTVYPEGTGTWVAPGQQFRFQMHYTPYGRETVEQTKVGLYFYPEDKPPQIMRRSVVVLNAGIEIPANTAHHEEIAHITFPEHATLFSVFPHAHYRGQSMVISLLRPGATSEELILSLPAYDFNWQRGYEFATPIQIEPGTKVITRYVYDNSKYNAANPDPNIVVKWGEQSWEEMQFTALGYRWKDETVANRKDDYQARLEDTRVMGMLDANFDGRVAKSELRGRTANVILATWNNMDADKDGFLTEAELAPISSMIGIRITRAAAQQGVGQ